MAWNSAYRTNGPTHKIRAEHYNALVDDDKTYGGPVDANGYPLHNLATPASDGDATPKAFVDQATNVSVRHFGAVGDGVTDDAAAIQAAVDSVIPNLGPIGSSSFAGSRRIYFPAGTYLIQSPINFYSGQILFGDGRGTVIKAGGSFSGDALLYGEAVTSNYIQGVEIGHMTLEAGAGIAAITVDETANLFLNSKIHDIYLNCVEGIILAGYAQHNQISRIYSFGAVDRILYLQGNDNFVDTIDKEGTSGSSTDAWITVEAHSVADSAGNVLRDILLEGVGHANKPAMKLIGASGTIVENYWMEATVTNGYYLEVENSNEVILAGMQRMGTPTYGKIKLTDSAVTAHVFNTDSSDLPFDSWIDISADSHLRIKHLFTRRGSNLNLLARTNVVVENHTNRQIRTDEPAGWLQECNAEVFSSQNLFVNPSHAMGGYGWTLIGGSGLGTDEYITSEVGLGKMRHWVANASGSPYIYQNITVASAQVGQPLTLVALVKVDAATGYAAPFALNAGISALSSYQRVNSGAGWGYIIQTFTPQSAGTLQLGVRLLGAVDTDEMWIGPMSACWGMNAVVSPARYETFDLANKSFATASAAPTTGTWKVGDVAYNTSFTAGGTWGWVCTTAGTPGTWTAVPDPTRGVSGPASSVDDHIVTFDGTTGKLTQDSGLKLVASTGLASVSTTQAVAGSQIDLNPLAADGSTAAVRIGRDTDTSDGVRLQVLRGDNPADQQTNHELRGVGDSKLSVNNGNVGVGNGTIARKLDVFGTGRFSGLLEADGGFLPPHGTTLPVSGYVGEIFIKTDEPVDEQFHVCVDDSPVTWQKYNATGGGGSGSLDVEVDGSAVGTEDTLNLVTGTGVSLTGSNPTGKSQVTVAVDTATIPTKAALQAGTPLYVAPASASATTYAASLSPALTAYTTGMVLHFKPDVGNSGAATLNIDSLGAKAIKLSDGSTDVSASDLDAGKLYHLWYDGTAFRCVAPVEGGSGGGGASNLDELTDVAITTPATRHGLFHNGSGQFVNRTIEAADLPNTAVTPGSYTAADITVDAQGRITAAANGSGSAYDPLDRTWIYLVDEFLGGQVANGFGVGIGELGWNSTGTTGAATYTEVNSVLGHPGSLRDLRTGATSTNTAYLTLGGGGSNLTTILGTQLHTYSGWSMEFELRTHASDIANIYIGAGFYGDANLTDAFANTDSRIAIEFSTAQSDTEWMLAVYHSGTGTRTATGVTVAANTYYRLRIEGDSTGSVRAVIDGGTPTSSVTSNLPTASGHIAFCVQTHTSAEKKLYYDRFAAKIKRQ